MNDNAPISTQISHARAKRRRRRAGVMRARAITAVFGVALVFGFVAGCSAPGA